MGLFFSDPVEIPFSWGSSLPFYNISDSGLSHHNEYIHFPGVTFFFISLRIRFLASVTDLCRIVILGGGRL